MTTKNAYCFDFIYCIDNRCKCHHFKNNNFETRLVMKQVKDQLANQLENYYAELKPGIQYCNFGDACFHNESDCKYNHTYTLDGRKLLKKTTNAELKKIKIMKEINDMSNGMKTDWNDLCK